MIKEKRREWHKLYQQGVSCSEIANIENTTELIVVRTLKNPTPKIKGANYNDLKIPIPQEEVVEAYYNNSIKEVAKKYEVSTVTVKNRLPKGILGTKPHTRKVDKITEEDETEAINSYYLSGRKLNATKLTPVVLKQLLDRKGLNKQGRSLNPRYQVALVDSILTTIEDEDNWWFSPLQISRKLYDLKGDQPQAWKGQVLDWFLSESINEPMMRVLYKAIEDVSKHMGYEDVDL